ncbi:MAG: nucleotide exchange factor GrpE [Candidatus Curtissbacteria bacterium]|nr:nucleotide exchange factor GrpE [Candidatus Curtissbacteria bacterium]
MKTKRPTALKDDMAKKQLEDQLKRALADYQNLERRVEEERRLLSQLSSALLIEKLLPVLDNLESAQAHLNDQGLDIVIKQFKDILNSEGVEEIQADEQEFDPNLHEATEVTEGENDNRIVKVVRKGYKIGDKVLRVAQVVVEKRSAGQTNEENEEEKVDRTAEFNIEN